MPFIRNLYVASLTSTLRDCGSDSELVVIMNQGGLDVVHRDLGFGGPRPAAASSTAQHRRLQILPENYICGSAPAATMLATAHDPAWCNRFTSGAVVPLGYDEELEVVLSTDPDEGRISLPLRPITPG